MMYLQLTAEEADDESADSTEEEHIDYRELEQRGQMTLPFSEDHQD